MFVFNRCWTGLGRFGAGLGRCLTGVGPGLGRFGAGFGPESKIAAPRGGYTYTHQSTIKDSVGWNRQ